MAGVSDEGWEVIDAEDDDERAFRGDTERLLGRDIDPLRYPILAAAMASPNAAAFRGELIQLFARQLRARAPRRALRVMCRLEGQGYDEPVLIKDISATGVRFLVQSDVSLDLTQFDSMRLQVRVSAGPRTLAVALVRRCGGDQRHTDLACRFVAPAADHQETVTEIRSKIFSDSPLPPDAGSGHGSGPIFAR